MIASEGEQKSAKALMEAARIMASSPSALQLRQSLIMIMIMIMMIASIFPPCHDYKGWECVIFPPNDDDAADDENSDGGHDGASDTCKLSPPCHDDNRWECVIIIFPPSDCDDDD